MQTEEEISRDSERKRGKGRERRIETKTNRETETERVRWGKERMGYGEELLSRDRGWSQRAEVPSYRPFFNSGDRDPQGWGCGSGVLSDNDAAVVGASGCRLF